jgi:hypothetical protein
LEEKDELIEKTKKNTLEKYGVRVFSFSHFTCVEKISWQEIHANNRRNEWVWLECK